MACTCFILHQLKEKERHLHEFDCINTAVHLVFLIACFRNLVTVSAKITQWEGGVTSVSLDITIYRLITRLVAKVTQFISYKLYNVTVKSYVVAWIACHS